MGAITTSDVVRDLIEQSGISQAKFANAIGLDSSKLSKSLAGKRRFTSLDLARIAEFTDTTVDELLGTATPRPALAARAMRDTEPTVVEQAIDIARRYASARENLAFLKRARTLPAPFEIRRSRRLIEQAAALASEALDRLGNRDRVLDRDLASTVEHSFQIDVAVEPLGEGFDGLAWRDDYTRLILVSATRVPGRQRFTIAHELGHILSGDDQDLHVDEDVYDRSRRDGSEMRANAFAAAFLMPEDVLRTRVGNGLTDRELARLCCEMTVSPSSLSWRLFNLGLIDEMTRQRFGAKTALSAANEAGWTQQFAQWVDQSSARRVPTRLFGDMLSAYLDGVTTLRPLSNLVGVDVGLLEQTLESVESEAAPQQ